LKALEALKRYRKRRAIIQNIRAQIGEAERADAIYELIRFDLEEVEQHKPISFGQYQLICAAMMVTVSKLSSNRQKAIHAFRQIEKLARMVGNHEKSKEAA